MKKQVNVFAFLRAVEQSLLLSQSTSNVQEAYEVDRIILFFK